MLKGPGWESDAVELVGRLVCKRPSLPPSLSEHVSRAGRAGRAADCSSPQCCLTGRSGRHDAN